MERRRGAALGKLTISPSRSTRERLTMLARHFKEHGTLFAVTDGNGPVHVSKRLGVKVRDHTRSGALDWLLDETREASEGIGQAKTQNDDPATLEVIGLPQVGQDTRFVTARPWATVVATLLLRVKGPLTARDLRVVDADTGETGELIGESVFGPDPAEEWRRGITVNLDDLISARFALSRPPQRVRFELILAGKVVQSEVIALEQG